MGWLDKLFGKEEPATTTVVAEAKPAVYTVGAILPGLEGIRFGRYSDNNKSSAKTKNWYLAEERFKEKAYMESFTALFDYMRDDEEDNVTFRPDGNKFTFELVQGSKRIIGHCDGERIVAQAAIAIMEQPSNAVMRRLLELNFTLYYTRCALDDKNTLCMIFDTTVNMASPNKLYFGLRELAKFADKQDDLLVADFTTLKATDIDHIRPLSVNEQEVKYRYFRKWIEETLARVKDLNADSFSGAIAYAFLTLLYRIDFLIVPEAKLMADMEAVSNLYWHKKEETAIVERNTMMRDAIAKLLDITREQFAEGVYHSKGTFSITAVPPMEKVRENVHSANKDAEWYVENKFPELALIINEYGVVYNQFSFSMPRVLTDLTTIYMATVHADFFKDLGLTQPFYDLDNSTLYKDRITAAIDAVIGRWTEKYASMKWDHSKVSYKSLWDFADTFTEQMVSLNLEVKR
jgi:hypothetical protein